MKAAVVDKKSKKVVNIILADANFDVAPDGCMLVNVTDFVDIGWKYDGSKFVKALPRKKKTET